MNLHEPKTAKVLGFFLVLIFFKALFASGTTTIQVLDLWDFSPLPNVSVKYNDNILLSDSTGIVNISYDSRIKTSLDISREGYYSKQILLDKNNPQNIIYLQPLQQTEKIQINADRATELNLDVIGPNSVLRISPVESGNSDLIASLLNNSTGVFVKNYGASGVLKTISIRGLGSEQTAINYDGININNKQLGLIELSLLNLQNVTKIELYRGGNSSLFGSGAIAGAVNFVSVLPTSQFQYLVYNSYGSWNNIQNSLMANFSTAGINHRINLKRQKSVNDFEFTIDNKNYNRLNSDQNLIQFGYSVYHEKSKILAEILLSKNKRGVAKLVLDQVKTVDFARQKDFSIFSRLKWIPFPQSEFQVYWMKHDNEYNDPGLVINNQELYSKHTNNVLGLQFSNGMILFNTIRSNSKFEIENSKINSTDAGYHKRLRTALSSILESSIYKISDLDLKLSGSFRWENYSETGNIVLPKIGLSLANKSINLYSSFGYNYRIPTFNELYWQPGGNKNLNPEESNNFESGISYTNIIFGQFTLTFDYYRNQITNMIRWVPDNQSSLWSPVNISAVKSEGIEFGFNVEVIQDLIQLNSNYSYSQTIKTKAEFDGDNTVNNQVPFIPREMANIGLKIKWKNWRGDLNWNRTGFRYLTYSNSANEFLPSHYLVDLTLGYDLELFDQFCNINFILNNLFNKNYQVMYGYPMPGRNFQISINIHN